MGKIHDEIRQEIYKTIIMDTIKTYEFINTRFELSEEQKDEVVLKLNACAKDITSVLDKTKLL